MSQHTPGPWTIDDDGRTIKGRDGENVGGCVVLRMIEANARLITAAPDMYKAIKEYMEWGPMTGSDRDLHTAAFRAAIAKAEGNL
jgi:hypothetical protein